jgi:hypothetical protein
MDDHVGRDALESAVTALGDVLEQRGLAYDVVLIGGAALLLRGVIARPTKDVDLLGERLPSGEIVALDRLPDPLARAVADVGRTFGLAPDWVNVGPRWPARDRHLADLRALQPDPGALREAARWAMSHDPSPGFRDLLAALLAELGIEDPDELLR